MDPEQLQELLMVLKDAGVRSYEHDPNSGGVRLEFFPEQPEHETIVQEQPAAQPSRVQRALGYDQLFKDGFPAFNNGGIRG